MKESQSKMLKKHYDEYYKTYDPAPDVEDKWQWALTVFPQAELALEVGCRTGVIVRVLTDMDVDIRGIDFADARHLWKQHMVADRCQIADVREIPYGDNVFDYVFALKFLQHIAEEDVDLALKETYRVGKRLFLLTINQEESPTNLTMKPNFWWIDKMMKVGFNIPVAQNFGNQLHIEAVK